MTLRQQQIGVFLGTVIVMFGLSVGAILGIAQRLTDEATLQTALLLARQVEIALADSLQQQRMPASRPRRSPWDFLGRLFPGRSSAKAAAPSPRTEVKGLMRAFVDRSSSIQAMWVLNQDGKVLYASRSREEGQIVSDPQLRENLRQGITTIASRREGDAKLYDVLVPLQMPKEARGPGGLRLWVDSADLKELLSGIGQRLTVLFLIAGAVALGSAFLTTALYTKRFRLISEALTQAEAGTYRERPRYAARDEVGASLDLIDRLVMKQRGAGERPAPFQRLAVATRTLAHEVRTPLNALAVHLEVLRAQSQGVNGGAHHERSLTALDGSIRQLDQLVRDFTDYTAPVVLDRHSIDAAAVLQDSLEAAKAQCASQGITVRSEFPPAPWPIQGDASKLRQAFDNLFRNAIEAQPDGGEIRVTGDLNGSSIILRFSDSGPGIPPDRRATLFDFGCSTKSGGSGIGLPLSQLIIEAHGGTLRFEETDGELAGATFCVSVPLEQGVG